jgi:hypothetical protein
MAKIPIVNAAPVPKVSITCEVEISAGFVGNIVGVGGREVTIGTDVVCGVAVRVGIPGAKVTYGLVGMGVSVSIGV